MTDSGKTISSAVPKYKTLREIDGVQYITVKEHEEIIGTLTGLLGAVNNLQASLRSLESSAKTLSANFKEE